MNAPVSQPAITIWRPWSISVGALLLLSVPVVVLFVTGWRSTGVIFLLIALVGIAKQPIAVRVTDSDVFVRSFLKTTQYPLKEIKEVVWLGGTSTAVRLEFFGAKPVQISNFLIDGTDHIYKAITAAREHAITPTTDLTH